MTGNYSEKIGAVKSDLQALRGDLEELTRSFKAEAQANVSEFRDNATTKFKAAQKNAVEAGAKGQKQAQAKIKQNPIVSIAAAAGLGLAVGALIARR